MCDVCLLVQSDRIGVDEDVNDTKGLTEQQVKEMMAEREAKANAQLLEMVGCVFIHSSCMTF